MRTTRISQGGQIQIPADIRRRWGTVNVIVEDLGNEISVRPVPDDPISAALAPLPGGRGFTSEELVRTSREEEAEAEERKWRDSSRRIGTHWRDPGPIGEA